MSGKNATVEVVADYFKSRFRISLATDDTDAAATLLNALFPIARRAMQHHSELRNDPQVPSR